MFRKEGLEEIRVDIERATNIDVLRGIATAMHGTTVHAAEEIAQLKAELELTKKERDQAIAFGGVDDCSPDYPDLYEHFKRKAQAHKDFLAGRGK